MFWFMLFVFCVGVGALSTLAAKTLYRWFNEPRCTGNVATCRQCRKACNSHTGAGKWAW